MSDPTNGHGDSVVGHIPRCAADAGAGPVIVDVDGDDASADGDDARELAADANGDGTTADAYGTPAELEALLDYLKLARGFDFTGYKRVSLSRRIVKRLAATGAPDFRAYLHHLELHPAEFDELFNTVLINVTAFFRDPEAWEYVAKELVPRILARKRATEPVRAWSACCASGEEAYTIAMIFAEALGVEQFRERVKIYATDLDEHALGRARAGVYARDDVTGIPPELLERYFVAQDGSYTFRADMRRCVIFGRHDLMQDAPISRVDLLACRNALMYFNSEAQSRILARFHFALPERGFLFLGRAETLLTHSSMFSPVDLKRRVFAKVPRTNLRDRLAATGGERGALSATDAEQVARTRDAAFDTAPAAQIVVDAAGRLAMANERARMTFGLMARDVGRPLQDLELSYRPVELRSCIERAYADNRVVSCGRVAWRPSSGEPQTLEVTVAPLADATGTALGASVIFADVTAVAQLQAELERANEELESAYEELQSTNEELETTNEELQSTVEELETTNEELQSTNEELETMNEELQSANEELQSINDEVRVTSDARNDVNALLEAILTGLRGGVIVLDREMNVLLWNEQAEKLWGLRADEVEGRHLQSLDIGLPVEQLKPGIRACLSGAVSDGEIEVDATNRRGRPMRCVVRCSAMRDGAGEIRGVILVVEPQAAADDR